MQRESSIRAGRLWLCVCVLAFAHAGQAQPFDVTSTDDDGAGTLRDAVTDANGNAGDDTVTFTFTEANNTITLLSPLPPITPGELILDGTGDDVTIDGSGNTILEVQENVEVIDIALMNGTISISADRILTLDMPQNLTSTANIDGAGGLTKEGAGLLFLTGALDYTGVTTITEGTLSLDSIVTGDIVNNGALRLDLADPARYSGIMSGTGDLTKLGLGTLTLDGLNSYSGATTVNAGTLVLEVVNGTNRFAIEGEVTIETNGTLVFDFDDSSITFMGDIDSAGALTKDGTGRLVLSGNNSGTGTTSLNGGSLEGTSDSISGDVVAANGTTLAFVQDFDGSYAGDITSAGAATIMKEGTGNLRLDGDNTGFGGTLQLSAGTVTGNTTSLPELITNDAALIFDQTTSEDYDGVVSGTGTVQKTGNGTLTLTTPQTYTGLTTISGGRLDVIASLASPVTVDSGGTLGGTGSIGGAVIANGNVAPGTSVGTLTLNDTATFGSGSTLEVEIDPGGTADRLDIAGTLTVEAGATVVPQFNNLTNPITGLTIVTSGGRTGTFEVENDLAFQSVTLGQVDDDVTLSIAFADIFAGANTTNQNAVATALDNAANDGLANELDDAVTTLLTSSLSSAQGARALDEIGPEALSQFNTARLALAQRLGDTAGHRVRTVFSGGAKPLFGSLQTKATTLVASAPAIAAAGRFGARTGFGARHGRAHTTTRGGLRSFEPEAGTHGFGGWLDGYGGFGTLDGDSGTADADYVLTGATLGLDYRVTPNVLLGLAGGWGFTDLEVDDRSADGDAHTYHGLAYAGYATPRFHLGLSGHYGFSQMETSRRIRFATVAQTADGDFDGETYGGRLEAGINVAELYGVLFQPIAHFDISQIEQDSYRESGSPAFNLNVDSESIDSQISSVGLRLHGAWALPEDTGSFEPELIGRWEHQFGDDERPITGTLQGDASATPIALRGADAPTDRYLVQIGWVVSNDTGLRTTLGYTGAFSSEQMEHAGSLRVEYAW
jgi:autotransporter-associated beta strand protein